MVPEGSNWAAFGIGAMQMPMAAQAVLLGGNVRVGLEDNLYLEKGVFASNGSLVEKVGSLINHMGASIMSAKDALFNLNLRKTVILSNYCSNYGFTKIFMWRGKYR